MTEAHTDSICPICKKKANFATIYPYSSYNLKHEYGLSECAYCKTAHTVPLPTESVLESLYKESYGYEVHSLIEAEKVSKACQILKYFSGNKKILDYGCSYGIFLDQAKNLGHYTYGIEIYDKLAQQLRLKGHIIYKKIDEIKEDKFDIILLNHSLEHILNLEIEMTKIVNSLSENGEVIVLLPNYGSRWRILFNKSWGWYQQPIHIWHFNLHGLQLLFRNYKMKMKYNKILPGDSLLVLLTLNNALHLSKKNSKEMSRLSQLIIYLFSQVWLQLGRFFSRDEIFAIFKK